MRFQSRQSDVGCLTAQFHTHGMPCRGKVKSIEYEIFLEAVDAIKGLWNVLEELACRSSPSLSHYCTLGKISCIGHMENIRHAIKASFDPRRTEYCGFW